MILPHLGLLFFLGNFGVVADDPTKAPSGFSSGLPPDGHAYTILWHFHRFVKDVARFTAELVLRRGQQNRPVHRSVSYLRYQAAASQSHAVRWS